MAGLGLRTDRRASYHIGQKIDHEAQILTLWVCESSVDRAFHYCIQELSVGNGVHRGLRSFIARTYILVTPGLSPEFHP